MKQIFLSFFAIVFLSIGAMAQPEIHSQWEGKRVAFLGDSITEERQIPKTNNVFWNNLSDILGTVPYVYGISGHRMNQIIGQGEKLEKEHGQSFDAIIVLIGTNDYNANVPMGEWYITSEQITIDDGPVEVARRHREMNMDESTFKGRTNKTLLWLKTHFPDKQIIFLTPIHRGIAHFNDKNIQPPESFANANGFFIDDYVQAIKEISNIWAVPVIDLNSVSGLYPVIDEHTDYFRNADIDRLHPNTPGHRRMAYSIAYQLLSYPAYFPKYVTLGFDGKASKNLQQALRSLGVTAEFPSDAQGSNFVEIGSDEQLDEVINGVKDGDIILLHNEAASIDAAKKLVSELQNRGFEFVSREQLFKIRGFNVVPRQGKIFTNVY